jgi:hypothetical protein
MSRCNYMVPQHNNAFRDSNGCYLVCIRDSGHRYGHIIKLENGRYVTWEYEMCDPMNEYHSDGEECECFVWHYISETAALAEAAKS